MAAWSLSFAPASNAPIQTWAIVSGKGLLHRTRLHRTPLSYRTSLTITAPSSAATTPSASAFSDVGAFISGSSGDRRPSISLCNSASSDSERLQTCASAHAVLQHDHPAVRVFNTDSTSGRRTIAIGTKRVGVQLYRVGKIVASANSVFDIDGAKLTPSTSIYIDVINDCWYRTPAINMAYSARALVQHIRRGVEFAQRGRAYKTTSRTKLALRLRRAKFVASKVCVGPSLCRARQVEGMSQREPSLDYHGGARLAQHAWCHMLGVACSGGMLGAACLALRVWRGVVEFVVSS